MKIECKLFTLILLFRVAPTFGLVLQSAAEPDYPPLSIAPPTGIDGMSVELLRATVKEMDMDVHFHSAPWSQIKDDLILGSIDVLPLVSRTAERNEFFDFSIPYLTLHGAIFIRNDDVTILDLNDLKGKRIAVMKGDTAEEYVRRAALSDQLITTPTFGAAFRMLAEGRADAVLAQKLMGISLLKSLQIDTIRIVGKPSDGFKQTFSFAVKKGNGELLAKLNEGLSILNANGTARKINQKWLGTLEQEDAKSPLLIYGGDHAYPPFEFLDSKGRPSGFNIDLLRALSRHTGIDIAFQLTPWNQVIEKARNGKLDLMAMNYSKTRAATMEFSSPLQPTPFAVFARQDSPVYTGIEQLKSYPVAVQQGSLLHEFSLQNGLTNHLTATTDPNEILQLLVDGEVDFALDSLAFGRYWIKKNGFNNLRVAEPKLIVTDYCLCTRKGQNELIDLINTALFELRASGEYRRIYNQWMSPFDPQAEWYVLRRRVLIGFAVLLLVSAVATLWIFSLRRKVYKKTTELRASEERLDIATRAGGLGVWDWDLVHNRMDWDPRMIELYGIQPDEFSDAHTDWQCGMHPDDIGRVAEEIAAAQHGGKEFNTECRIVRPDGEIRNIRVYSKVTRLKDGTPVRMTGTSQDITERKLRQEELKESKAKYQALYENSPLPYQSLDEDGCFLDVNPAWLHTLGYDRDEVIGSWFGDFLHPDFQPVFIERFPAFKACGSVRDAQFKIRHKKGMYRTIAFEGCAGYLPDGCFKQTYCVFQDITERLEAEALLQESENNLRNIIETLPLAISLTSGIDQSMEYINSTFSSLFGYNAEEIPYANDWYELAYPDPAYRNQVVTEWTQRVQLAIATQSAIEPMETVVACKDGTTKNMLWGYIPIGEKNYAYGLDLTAHKIAIDNLAKSAQHLELAQSTARLGSWEQDCVKDTLFWSDMAFDLFGLDPQQDSLTTELFFEIVHPADRELVRAAFLRSLKPEEPPFDMTHRICRIDTGAILYLHERCTHFRDASGAVIKSIGTIQDVTELKQMQDSLAQTAQEWQITFNASNDAIWLLDKDHRILRSNQEADTLFPYVFGEKGARCWDIVHGTKAPVADCPFERAKKSLHRETMELPIGERWYLVTADPILDADRHYIGAVHVMRDITAGKQAQKDIKDSEEKFSSAFNDSPIPLAITDTETGERLSVNKRFIEVFGYSRDQLLQDNLYRTKLAVDNKALIRMVAQLKRDGFIQNHPFQMVTIKGEVRDLLVSAAKIKGSTTDKYIISHVDITDQKRAAADLERHQLKLESEVMERTKELRQIVNVMAGRENRMAELKLIINQLRNQLAATDLSAPAATEDASQSAGEANERPI